MMDWLERMGLTPQERRLVVAVAVVVFAVLNLWLVWPHFKDWKQLGGEIEVAKGKIAGFKTEIDRVPEYQARLKKLEGEGAAVLPEEQANKLQSTIQTQASLSQVTTAGINPVGSGSVKATAASQFFEEQAMLVRFITGDSELINFLVSLGSGQSLIRVRDLNIKPDPSQTKLQGQCTVVASFQKRVDAKRNLAPAAKIPGSAGAATNSKPAAPAPRPGANPPAAAGTGRTK